MTPDDLYCTLGKHWRPASEMRKPPPSAPNRRQCNDCARGRSNARYIRKPERDWASEFLDRLERVGDCIEWTGALANGYGAVDVAGTTWRAHRLSFALHNGDLPAGALICHHCDNKACCNPSHLYAGDVQTNSDDAVARNRLRPPLGEHHGQAVLTEGQVREIRRRSIHGEARTALAREFGVTPGAIYRVVKRATWKHVA